MRASRYRFAIGAAVVNALAMFGSAVTIIRERDAIDSERKATQAELDSLDLGTIMERNHRINELLKEQADGMRSRITSAASRDSESYPGDEQQGSR